MEMHMFNSWLQRVYYINYDFFAHMTLMGTFEFKETARGHSPNVSSLQDQKIIKENGTRPRGYCFLLQRISREKSCLPMERSNLKENLIRGAWGRKKIKNSATYLWKPKNLLQRWNTFYIWQIGAEGKPNIKRIIIIPAFSAWGSQAISSNIHV